MENPNEELCASKRPPETSSTAGASRRGFLGGMGAVGLLGIAGALAPSSAEAAPFQSSTPSALSSISKLNVTRDETFDVPGGKEHFIEWQVSDDNGVTKAFITHCTRVDADVTYMISMNIVIQAYGQGMDTKGTPASSVEQNITVFAIKGDVVGSVRNDHVTITTIHGNGSTSRQSQVGPIRMDVSEFVNMDTATMIATIGDKFVGKNPNI